MMDKIAEKLAEWFGSVPFIVFHVVWFTAWILLHSFAGFDEDWSNLTLVVSLEAIFLSLFILRAENVATQREDKNLKKDLRVTKEILEKLDKIASATKR